MDAANIIQAVAALAFVIALIGICSVLYRRYVIDKNLLQGNHRRLRIEENLYLDAKRKLVLVRKDDEEILILVGTNSESVISTNPAASSPAVGRRKIAKP